VAAAAQGAGAACASLSLAWSAYIAWAAAGTGADSSALVDLAMQVGQGSG